MRLLQCVLFAWYLCMLFFIMNQAKVKLYLNASDHPTFLYMENSRTDFLIMTHFVFHGEKKKMCIKIIISYSKTFTLIITRPKRILFELILNCNLKQGLTLLMFTVTILEQVLH